MYEKDEVGPLGKCHLILDPSLTSDRSIPRVKALSSHLPRFYEKNQALHMVQKRQPVEVVWPHGSMSMWIPFCSWGKVQKAASSPFTYFKYVEILQCAFKHVLIMFCKCSIYIYICIMYIYIYICMYVCMDGWMHACMYACMHACTNVCAYVRTCIRTYVSMYECMNV